MKKEPLKGKLQEDNTNWSTDEDDADCVFVENYFEYDDVKSAVQWLKKELTVKDSKKLISQVKKDVKVRLTKQKKEVVDMCEELDGDDKETMELLIKFWEDMMAELPNAVVNILVQYNEAVQSKIDKAFEDIVK